MAQPHRNRMATARQRQGKCMATARQLLGQGIGVGFGMGARMSGTRVAFTEKTRDHYEDSNSSRMCWRSRTSYDNDELFRTTQLPRIMPTLNAVTPSVEASGVRARVEASPRSIARQGSGALGVGRGVAS